MGRRDSRTILIWLLLVIAGCSTTPSRTPEQQTQAPPRPAVETAPHWEPPSRTGNPESYEVFGKRYYVMDSSEHYRRRGTASWYGDAFHGKKTSSGVPFDMYKLTAAHKRLPIPTYVRVTHLGNGRSIVVKINDRGPFVDDRLIDLSYAAAAELDMLETGTAPVEVVALAPYQYLSGSKAATPRIASATPRPTPGHTTQPAGPGPLSHPVSPLPSRSAAPPAVGSIASAPSVDQNLYVQVGAFSQRQNAERLQHELTRHVAYGVRIDPATGPLYKVRVGPLHTATEAQRLVAQLTHLGINTPTMVFE
jgi:rare lipoprotein A